MSSTDRPTRPDPLYAGNRFQNEDTYLVEEADAYMDELEAKIDLWTEGIERDGTLLTELRSRIDELEAELLTAGVAMVLSDVPSWAAEAATKRVTELEGALREGIKAVRDGRGDATKTYMKVVDWANKYAALSGEQTDEREK